MQALDLHLKLPKDETRTECQQMTEGMLSPAISNAEVCVRYGASSGWQNVGLTEAMQVLSDKVTAVNGGSLSELEATLVAQSSALNSIFVELARRAHSNMGTHLEATERYLKLALKAQSQCRTTIETLAVIKNPPVFAKQANINNGGNQQINNGQPPSAQNSGRSASREQRAGGKSERNQQTELLEVTHGERLDTRTKSKARRGNQAMETMGKVHRTQDA